MAVKIIEGDCLEQTRQYENYFDSIVTDPPYGLKFMGKDWDHGVPGKHYWEQFLQSAKPGAHLLAFGGTRTHHRLMVAIEDAGWEIRDTLMWVYGSGFPKSLDVSKAIDKEAGVEREVIGINEDYLRRKPNGMKTDGATAYGYSQKQQETDARITAPATDLAKQWFGWGTALKPAWEPIILARKPLDGTVAKNVLKWGCGGINIDGCRIEFASEADRETSHKNGLGPIERFVTSKKVYDGGKNSSGFPDPHNPKGRFPANLIHDGSDAAISQFPQSNGGAFPVKSNVPTGKGYDGGWGCVNNGVRTEMGAGSAARFFYCAKASKSERNIGCGNLPLKSAGECTGRQGGTDGLNSPRAGAGRTNGSRNTHPTVKPIALMRYLCRLITPPNGIIFDPFAGSGSTGVAATIEGFNSVLIEIDSGYANIARARNGVALPATPFESLRGERR